MIFVGDTAQLPPVHLSLSPALSEEKLELQFNCKVHNVILEDVVRQQAASGILFNATQIRELLAAEYFEGFKFHLDGFKDVLRIQEGNEFLELLDGALNQEGIDQTVLIVRSNKRAIYTIKALGSAYFFWSQTFRLAIN